MQRFFVNRTDVGLAVTFNWISYALDAFVNVMITGFIFFTAVPMYQMGVDNHEWWMTAIAIAAMSLFVLMTVGSLIYVIFPVALTLDRKDNVLRLGFLPLTKLSDIKGFDIVYTGLISPSRYGLVARLDEKKIVRVATTGYFGKKMEMEHLKDILNENLAGNA